MAKKSMLEQARKAYNKSSATKYRVQADGKKTKKKKQKVKSHYGGVSKKAQDTEENRAESRRKTGGVAKTVGSNVVIDKTTEKKTSTPDSNNKNGRRSGAVSSVSSKSEERRTGAVTARASAKSVGSSIKKSTNIHKTSGKVTNFTQGSARGTSAGTAYNRYKSTDEELQKAGEKKVLTVKKEQLTKEQKEAQDRAAKATRFYTNTLVASGKMTQAQADKAVKTAKEKATKDVKDSHTLTYSNSAQSNENVQRVANATPFANTEVEDKKAKEKAIRAARFYTNSQVAAGKMSQKEADKIVKEAGKGHRTTQSANILDELGGEGFAEEQGTRQAGQMNDSKVASGIMQGLSYGDNTRAVGKYNQQAAELVDTVKQSGAFNVGYMIGQGGQFVLGGTNKMTDALVKGVTKGGAMRSALNVGLRKGGADMMFEAPLNTFDAIKMSTDANGNFDKKAFFKYMALNTGLSGGMGGVIGGVGAKMTKSDVRKFAELSEKLNKNIELTPDELSQYSKIQNKLDNALKGNDRVKEDYINAGKADAVLSKADNKEYMSLLGKKQAGNLSQQERVRLSSYENVVKQNYDKAQDNYAKILADVSGGEKVAIKDVKEATGFFERSGNMAKALEAETILKDTTKERQLEIIKKTNPKDESLGDHTWVESVDDIKSFDEAINSDEAGFTPDFTKEMADEALGKGEITVYSSKPIEDGAFVTPSKMEAESYAGGGEVFEQTIKTDDVAWLDELQGQVAKVSDEPLTKSYDEVFKSDTIDETDMKSYMENAYKENFVDDDEAIKIAKEATEELQRIGNSLGGIGRSGYSRERVVADRFSRRLINGGAVEIRGTRVSGLADLAEVMQVCRDPRFETSRIVYMKGDTIVGMESVTSNMPTFTRTAPDGMLRSEHFEHMRHTMRELDSDGYYFVHNHPASFTKPSDDDVATALHYQTNVDGYKGDLIINHKTYGTIKISGTDVDIQVHKREGDIGEDLLKNVSIDHPVLSESMVTDRAIADALKQVENDKLVTTIIYADNRGQITGAETISNALAADKETFREFLKRRTTHYGASRTYIGTHDSTVIKNAEYHILNGDITNCISFKHNPRSVSVGTKKKINRPKDVYFGKHRREYVKDSGVSEPPTGGSFNGVIESLTKNADSAEAFSKAEKKEITDTLAEISKALENGDTSTARSIAEDLAQKYGKIDEGYKVSNDALWEEVKGAQEYLRGITIHTPEGSGTLKEIKEKYTGDADWHNIHIRQSKNGKMQSQGVDEVWDELVGEFPEVFSREITDPMERLQKLSEVSSMRKADTQDFAKWSDEDISSMREDMVDEILASAEKNVPAKSEADYYNGVADSTIEDAKELVGSAKETPKAEPKKTPKAEAPKKKPAKKKEPKEPEKSEVQKLHENDFASDEVKTALKDIEEAGVNVEKAEKIAKRFNDLDKKIGAKTKHIENAKKSEKYATEAERTERIAELNDELETLKRRQAKAAGELEQLGKMKAVDPDKTAEQQIKEMRGERKVNKELKNTENLTKTDNWIKDKWNSVRRLWEDSLIDVENTAKASGDLTLRNEILTAANRVRNSMSVANNWITKTRSKFDNTVGGKALDDIFNKELIDNEPKYADFQEYLIMKHVPARHAKGTDIYPEVSPELATKRVKELEDKYRPKDKDGNPLLDKDGKPVKSEVETWADDVYDYINDLQQYRVDSGMLSKEAADQFAKDYPFYIPTNRVSDENIDFFTGGTSNGIRSAKGGDSDVLDIYSQLYTATNKTIHAAEENQMLNLYFKAKGVTEEQLKDATLDDLEHAVIEAKVNKKTGASTVSFFVDGKPVRLPCNHQLALGLRELDGLEFERLLKAAKVATLYGKPFKALVTDWNLVFGVRNGARDLQQALVNSKDTKFFASSTGAAAHAIAHEDSPFRKLYASMGGEQAQLVSYDAVAKQMGIEKQGRVDAIHEKVQEIVDFEVKGKHINPIHYVEAINGSIEMMPRMCEFIGTIRKEADQMLKRQGSSLKQLRKEIIAEVDGLEKAGKIGQTAKSAEVEDRLANKIIDMVGKDTIDTAMRNANDITLNFGRSGVLGKALNMGFVPYLNPSIQGLSKLVRLFTEAGQEGGWKALASIGMKLGTFTIAPAVFNEVLLKDNEDYQNLNTRDKDNNFFIPLDMFGEEWEGKFFKFPKPRENAVLAEPVEYGLRYFLNDSEYAFFDWDKLKMEDVPLWDKIPLSDEGKQAFRTAIDNIGVINPATSNMISPLWQTFHNETWYGGKIESAYETSINEDTGKPNVPVNERYDVATSGIAIALGQTKVAKELNLSPKKIDNILDSYTGMIYDLGISQTTEEAKTRGNWLFRTMASQFVKDSVFSNKLSTNAWGKMDGMSKKEQDAYKSTYMYDTFKYDDAMDLITADKNLTNKQKMDAKRELQIAKNKLNREAIDGKPNTSNPLVDIAKHLGATKTLNHFLPDIGGKDTDTWTDYFKTYKNAKGYSDLTRAQKEKQSQKFLDVYALGVKGQLIQDPTKFHDSPSWGMTGVAAAELAKKGKLKGKDADLIMKSCGVYESQTEVYHNYADYGGNVKRYAITEKRVGKTLDKVGDWGMDTKSGLWKGTFDKSMGAKGGTIAMSLATSKKVDFKDRAYYIANSSDPMMLDKMNAARGFSEKYGHKTKEISKLALQADALGDGNTYLKNDEIINVCNQMKGNNEEKSMAYILLGGKPGKNPFGEIGDYSHDGDTGIQSLEEDKSGGHGGRGRRRRGRGGGGGGSSKGTMPKTESGAIKGKVTDVFASSNTSKASNLNDVYRKKVRKLRKELHK